MIIENKWISLKNPKIKSNTQINSSITENNTHFRKHIGLCFLKSNITLVIKLDQDNMSDELEEIDLIFDELSAYSFEETTFYINIEKIKDDITSYVVATCIINTNGIHIKSYSFEEGYTYKININTFLMY